VAGVCGSLDRLSEVASGLGVEFSENAICACDTPGLALDLLQALGAELLAQGLCAGEITFLPNILKPGTLVVYGGLWRRWWRFSIAQLACPFQVSGLTALRFAISLHSPSSLQQVRAVWTLISNFQVPAGILKYLQRARLSEKPVAPRYTSVFDVNLIFDFILTLGSYVTASFEELRLRVVLLLRIDLMCRSADLECALWGAISVSLGDKDSSLRIGFCRNKVWRAGGPTYTWKHVAAFIRTEYLDWQRFALSTPHVVAHYLRIAAEFDPDPLKGFLLTVDGSSSLGTEHCHYRSGSNVRGRDRHYNF